MMRLAMLSLALLALTCSACKDGELTTDCTSAAEIEQVLTQFAANAERHTASFVTSAEDLSARASAFAAAPDIDRLRSLRASLERARNDWQYAAPYSTLSDGTGLAGLRINPYPVDTNLVLAYLSDQTFDAASEPSFERGLGAIEYLLGNSQNDAQVLDRLTATPTTIDLLKAYADAILADAQSVRDNWVASSDEFVQRSGTAAGSGVSVIINAASKHLEDLRRDKVGTPLGVATLGLPNPQTVESPYAQLSLAYLLSSVEASRDLLTASQEGSSVLAYLRGIDNAEARSLADDIESQYEVILAAINAVQVPLIDAVSEDAQAVELVYSTLSRQVVHLKTDLPSVTCVAITYVDNPSDSD